MFRDSNITYFKEQEVPGQAMEAIDHKKTCLQGSHFGSHVLSAVKIIML